MKTFLEFLDVIIPIIALLVVVLFAVAWKVGSPICRYTALMSKAGTEEGSETFARHLSHKSGNPKIDVDDTWRSFLPLAKDLHQSHLEKRSQMVR